ncbi:MAG: RES domain-containing protein [Parvibaculaceae bacterium]
MPGVRPPRNFVSRPLVLAQFRPGEQWFRIYGRQHSDPLGYGYGPSRFSDPQVMLDPPARYAVVYLGSTIKVCFAETILRDQGDGRSYPLPVDGKSSNPGSVPNCASNKS